ncbi:hypothetical protein ACFPRL_04980 [Pseudoclavibacter helvolus]
MPQKNWGSTPKTMTFSNSIPLHLCTVRIRTASSSDRRSSAATGSPSTANSRLKPPAASFITSLSREPC